jgi:BirA family biotin operon repressor/biotin-[acetyl-CoA-carboxylase] ligase
MMGKRKIFYLKKVDSTQNFAKNLILKGYGEGTIVIAATQSSGRGRLDRNWISPKGGIYISYVLKPHINRKYFPLINLACGIAVAKAINLATGLEAKLKWPNDVLIADKKVCGILTETVQTFNDLFVIAGIGINVNVDVSFFPKNMQNATTSLKWELKKNISKMNLIRVLLDELEKSYILLNQEGRYEAILSEWKKLTNTLGVRVQVKFQQEVTEGLASDIDETGALIVKLDDGSMRKILAGDVSIQTKL